MNICLSTWIDRL